MAESAAYARRGFSGAARSTTLPVGISAGATTFDGVDLSTWAAADDSGPGTATITDGTTEETIEFTGVSSNTLTGVTRGVDGTTAVAWSAGATLKHTSRSRDFDEANYWVAELAAAISAGNIVLVSDADNSLVGVSMGASTILARLASGDVVAATPTQLKTLLAIANTDVSGLGTAATKDTGYTASKIPVLTATPGTPDGTKFLRDDGTWASPSASSSVGDLLDFQVVRKTAVESVTSSATLQDDDELFIAVGASQSWLLEWVLYVSSGSDTPDIKFTVTTPTSSSGRISVVGPGTSASAVDSSRLSATGPIDGSGNTVGVIATQSVIIVRANVRTTNSGNVKLQWAQNTSNGTSVDVQAESTLKAWRYA